MLIIRKEIKVGLAIAGAVLGVAVVYGGMSLLSGGGSSRDEVTFRPGDGQKPAGQFDEGVAGLPPAENAVTTPNVLPVPPVETLKADPFAESARADGQSEDKWVSAWNTGIVRAGAAERTPSHTPETIIRTSTPEVVPPQNPQITPEPTPRVETVGTPVAPTSGKYKIAAGDTYSSIAAKLYGKASHYVAIEKANPGVNPSKLKIGQEINVPAPQAVTSVSDSITTTGTVTGAIDATRQYRILPGDTLHKISQKLYGKTKFWAAIYDANKTSIGADAGRLKVGMVLNLPHIPTAD